MVGQVRETCAPWRRRTCDAPKYGFRYVDKPPKPCVWLKVAPGAAVAVEDAATLAECLKIFPRKDKIRNAIDLYEQLRIPRAKAIQEASNLHGITLHYADGPLQEARDAAMRPEVEGRHFVDSPNQWSDPMTQQFCYRYDPIEEVYEALQRKSKIRTPFESYSAEKAYQ